MLSNRFSGVHSALVTPFLKNQRIDFDAFINLLALQKKDGIHGFVIAGTTGESPTLTVKEKEQLVRLAKDHAGDRPIIAGAGSNSTNIAIELQKAMEDAGADATLQVVPYYNKPSERGLYEHFLAIAKIAKVPVILYNAYGRTGIDMSPNTVLALAKEHEIIIGVKDANPNSERLLDLIGQCKKARHDFLVLSGDDSSFLNYLSSGGDGVISVVSHIAAFEMLALYQAIKNGDFHYGQKIAHKINGICKLIFTHSNPLPIKTILAAMGLIEPHFRLPLCPLRKAEEEVLIKKCQDFSFLKCFRAHGFAQ